MKFSLRRRTPAHPPTAPAERAAHVEAPPASRPPRFASGHRAGVATLGLALAAALAVAMPLSASAHVRVAPNEAEAGSYAAVTFRVPTESATASTTKVEVDLPTDTPFSSASYKPVPGWTATVTTEELPEPVETDRATITEVATSITWVADDDSAIKPGEFQEFAVTLGPVPDTGSIMLPAHQTYSDGTVVDWDEQTPASDPEPEHPAPTLYVNDPAPGSNTPAASGEDTMAIVGLSLGIGGLGVGAIALVVALVVLVRQRSQKGSA